MRLYLEGVENLALKVAALVARKVHRESTRCRQVATVLADIERAATDERAAVREPYRSAGARLGNLDFLAR